MPQGRPIVASPDRIKKLSARLGEIGAEGWADALAAVRRSPFLLGERGTRFIAEIDWLLELKNLRKVLEGNYDDRERIAAPEITTNPILAAVLARRGAADRGDSRAADTSPFIDHIADEAHEEPRNGQ